MTTFIKELMKSDEKTNIEKYRMALYKRIRNIISVEKYDFFRQLFHLKMCVKISNIV